MSSQFVVMGVSGCGKSTLAKQLADALKVPFVEGDALHSPESVAKMAAGTPLTDEDRWPWLDKVGASIVDARKQYRGAVVSCSALKQIYRDRLREVVGEHLRFVMLDVPKDILMQRMRDRKGHYMPDTLLDSQLATLEHPHAEADVLVVDGTARLEHIVTEICCGVDR
jgi:gluconokinase